MPADYHRQLKTKVRQRRLHRDEEVTVYFNDILTVCYQLDPKMTDEDVVDKLCDNLVADMYTKVAMAKSEILVDFYAVIIMASGTIREENLVREKFATTKSFSRNITHPCVVFRNRKFWMWLPRGAH